MNSRAAEPRPLREAGLLTALVGDGRPLVGALALCLVLAGAFALFLAATGDLLPHDAAWLGWTSADLRAIGEDRVVAFMVHDRAAFGGTLVAIGVLYAWLAAVPLRDGEPWAWWTLVVSGLLGFASFAIYLPTGYLDTWHGLATLALVPLFAGGVIVTRRRLRGDRGLRTLAAPGVPLAPRTAGGAGRGLVLLTGFGMVLAGATILALGGTSVFVPTDLHFIGHTAAELDGLNPQLVPLIAHDRAGFGGGLATVGVAVILIAWCARPSRSQWEALVVAGLAGFGAAIGVHLAVGYLDLDHLGPAVLGAAVLAVGLALWRLGRPPAT